jgi:hypothetical protein
LETIPNQVLVRPFLLVPMPCTSEIDPLWLLEISSLQNRCREDGSILWRNHRFPSLLWQRNSGKMGRNGRAEHPVWNSLKRVVEITCTMAHGVMERAARSRAGAVLHTAWIERVNGTFANAWPVSHAHVGLRHLACRHCRWDVREWLHLQVVCRSSGTLQRKALGQGVSGLECRRGAPHQRGSRAVVVGPRARAATNAVGATRHLSQWAEAFLVFSPVGEAASGTILLSHS